MIIPTAQQLKAMTVKQLRDGLRDALVLTAEGIKLMAAFYNELLRRGEDLSAYSNPLMNMLPKIADGTLLPEALTKFIGNVPLVTQLTTLPIAEQQKLLVDNVKLPVLRRTDYGTEIVHRSPAALSTTEVYRVIRDGRILSPKEQRLPDPIIPPDRDRRKIDEWDVYHELTPTQRQQLTEKAGERGVTPAEYIKQVLVNRRDISLESATTTRERSRRHAEEANRPSL
jgi:hypothetical protein